jgi:hypothetical protein
VGTGAETDVQVLLAEASAQYERYLEVSRIGNISSLAEQDVADLPPRTDLPLTLTVDCPA